MPFLIKLWRRLIRFGFHLLYNELAFTYDWVSKIVSLGAWQCWQRSVFSYVDDDLSHPVLEIAHGTGDIQLDLHEREYNTIGLDISPYMGNIARRKLARSGVKPVLLRARGQDLPFAANQFPVLISTFPTPFIFETQTLAEIHRVLLPDGKLILVISGGFVKHGVAEQSLDLLYRITGQQSLYDEETQYDQIKDLFTAHGFSVEFHTELCTRSYAHVIVAQCE